MPSEFRPLVLIPVYDHAQCLADIVTSLRKKDLPVLLVDDASHTACAREIRRIASSDDQVFSARHAVNGGKGAAVITGFEVAADLGFTHVLQIDADGQHDLTATDDFLTQSREHPTSLICGFPIYDASVPTARLKGRQISNWWVHVNSLSCAVKDALCGFRVYPLAAVRPLLKREHVGKRMDFDIEILVRLLWQGTPVINRPVGVTYPQDGVSHFDLVRDNIRISLMHTRLFFGLLVRLPHLLLQRGAL